MRGSNDRRKRPASWRQGMLVAALAGLVTTAVFWPAGRGAFVWDDGGLIVKQHAALDEWADAVRAFARPAMAGEGVAYYRPIMIATFVADARLAGDFEAPTFHRTNVWLHGLNAALVALLLVAYGCGPWAAALGALLFGLHPLQCQAVALILGRNDLLLVPPVVAMLLADEAVRRRGAPRTADALVVLGFAVTLWTKETGIVSPLFLLCLDRFWRGRSWAAALRDRLPLFAACAGVAALYLATRLVVIGAVLDTGHYGRIAPLERIPLALAIVGYYVRHVVLPWGAAPAPYHPGLVDPGRSELWIAAGFVAALAVGTAIASRRFPRAAAGLLVFALALLPVSALGAPMKVLILDHRTYLPLLGIAIAAAAVRPATATAAGRAASVALLGVLALLTAERLPAYADSLSLWALAVEAAPESDYARNNYAAALMDADRCPDAITQLREALRLNPEYDRARFNLAGCLEYVGDRAEAVRELRLLAERRPEDVAVLTRLGLMLGRGGDPLGAADAFERALATRPDDPALLRHLADALDRSGRSAQAVPRRRRLVELEPERGSAWVALARSLAAAGVPAEAAAAYERALAIGPDTGQLRAELGRALFQAGRWPEAAAAAARARALGVVDAQLLQQLAEVGLGGP